MGTASKDTKHEENMESIAVATLEHQKDAAQKNLIILHRSVLVALFAAIVAVILGVIAIASKPTIIVKPIITLKSAN